MTLPTEEQHKWDIIGDLYDPTNQTCSNCQHNYIWLEYHVYGSTTASEEHAKCGLLDLVTGKPEDCQRLVDAVERQHTT